MALLEIEALTKHFPIRRGWLRRTIGVVKAVQDVHLSLESGQTVGLVGESGSGKTTLGKLILRLLAPTAGRVVFDGQDWLALSGSRLRDARQRMQVIFQDPFSALNPKMRVGEIVGEPMKIHRIAGARDIERHVVDLLQQVGLSERDLRRFPHEFSGGQRQRIGIARALILNPQLVICDEAVAALDVSVQAQTLRLLVELQQRHHMALLFISHDLRVVSCIAHQVVVLQRGHVVEAGPTREVLQHPRQEYTRELVKAAFPTGLDFDTSDRKD